jgi:pimeloyl-ACP methyl ester carboxylesterase
VVASRKKRNWLIFAALCLSATAAYEPLTRLITTARLLRAVRQVASGEIGKDAAVLEEKIVRRMGATDQEALVYRPSGSAPAGAVVLVAGVSELGCYHPRLLSLSRALARAGFLVLCPDIKMFRDFRIYPPPLDEISLWLKEVRSVKGGQRLRHVGLAGISFSGTLSLIAAARPQNRDLAAYVLGIGSFDDLTHCSDFWFGAGPVTVGPGYYPTRFYAKWVIMLAALDLLPAAGDREYLGTVLRSLLVQKGVPPPPESLTDQGRRWHRLALMREDETDMDLSRQIEQHVASYFYPALSTAQPAAEIHCPVFLAHGAYDDLIPAEESRRLQEKIVQAKSYLLISPFLTHTHPWQKPLGWWTKAGAFLDLLGFFYRLTGVL